MNKKRSDKDIFRTNRAFQDFIRCLVSYDKFNDRVLEIRKKFGIPKHGFKEEDEKFKSFFIDLAEKSDDMCDSQNLSLHDSRLPIVIFHRMESEIEKDFNLPPHLNYFLLAYIMSNNIKTPDSNFTIHYSSKKEKPPYVTITTYSKLTDQDLKKIKFLVNVNKNIKGLKSSPKLDRDLKIEEAYRGYTNLDKDYGDKPITQGELARNYLKSKKKNKQISDILNDLNKKRKKFFS